MQNANDIFQEDAQNTIGYIDTVSGSLLLTDGIWKASLPITNEQTIAVDLDAANARIPVYAVMRNGKRMLIIDIDGAQENTRVETPVQVEGVESDTAAKED